MNQALSSYWIFYTVANTGNISKAAKELYISQPAISKSIHKLEDNLKCKLFSRSSRGVVLTEEGQLLYSHVKEAFASLSSGEEQLRRSVELGVGHLQIGVSSTLCKHLLMPYLKEFIHQNPHVSISIDCQSTNEILRLLDDGKVDIGLVGYASPVKDIHFDKLSEIQDCFVASPEYLANLKKRGVHKEDMIKDASLLMLEKNNMSRRYIDAYLQDQHISTSDSIDVSNMDLLIDFAKIGVGLACVIKDFVQDELAEGSLIELPLSKAIPKRTVGFAYREGRKPSKTLESFITFYKNYQPSASSRKNSLEEKK